jgi:spermidine/putrescine transport system permease protein
MILPVYNAVEKIDPALLEASRDLGAGGAKTFFNVTLPLSMPGLTAGITLVFIPAVGMYFITDLLGGSRAILIGNVITDQMGQARNLPFAGAVSVTLMAGMFCFIGLFMKSTKRGGGFI